MADKPIMSSDQFIALERWLEAFASRHGTGPGVGPASAFVARQRAFTLLTGVEAPITAEDTMALADEAVERAQAYRKKAAPRPKPITPEEDEFA